MRKQELKFGFENLSEDKAYIAGTISGDASLSDALSYTKPDGTQQRKKRLSLDSCDREFVDRFRAAVVNVYGLDNSEVRANERTFRRGRLGDGEEYQDIVYRYQVSSTALYADLVSLFGFAPGEDTWRVPESIRNASAEIKAAFVAGFYDSEGSVAKSNRGVSVGCNNKAGMEDVRELLIDLGFSPSHLHHNANGSFALILSGRNDVRLFQRIVGLTIPKKAADFAEIVAGYGGPS